MCPASGTNASTTYRFDAGRIPVLDCLSVHPVSGMSALCYMRARECCTWRSQCWCLPQSIASAVVRLLGTAKGHKPVVVVVVVAHGGDTWWSVGGAYNALWFPFWGRTMKLLATWRLLVLAQVKAQQLEQVLVPVLLLASWQAPQAGRRCTRACRRCSKEEVHLDNWVRGPGYKLQLGCTWVGCLLSIGASTTGAAAAAVAVLLLPLPAPACEDLLEPLLAVL